MSVWYIDSSKWTAVTAWAASTSVAAGVLRRQLAAPAVNSERVFACIIAGTTLPTEPSWTLTKGAKTAESLGPTWQEVTGQPGVNGDLTNCPNWTSVKNTTPLLGAIIQRNNGVSLQICTTSGATGNGSEPAFSDTAGATTSDGSAVWTSLGAVGNFGAFAAPHARLANAFANTWMVAGDTAFLGSGHAETQAAAMTLTNPGTASAPCNVLCVSNSAAPPTACTTGASISATGANNIAGDGVGNYIGITFNAGSSTNVGSIAFTNVSSVSTVSQFENCGFVINNTNTNSFINLGSSSSNKDCVVRLLNCTFTYGVSNQYLQAILGTIEMISCSVSGSVLNGTFAVLGNNTQLNVRDCDLSNFTGAICNISGTTNSTANFQNVKTAVSPTLTTGSVVSQGGNKCRFHNYGNGSTNYHFYEKYYEGTVQDETTIVRAAGASNGATSESFNAQTSANASFYLPLQLPEIVQWNSVTGTSKTATVCITSNSTLTNGDIWMEIEYPGDASSPKGSVATNRKTDILASNTNITSDSSSWGGSTTTQQKLQVSFTPQQAGPVKARIFVAKPSLQVYVDPLITIA